MRLRYLAVKNIRKARRAAVFDCGRLKRRQRTAVFRRNLDLDGADDRLRFFEPALSGQPARTFRNTGAKPPDDDRTDGTEQYHPAPPIETEGLPRNHYPCQQSNDGNDAEGDALIEGECAPAQSRRHEFGDIRVDGDELHAKAHPGDEAPDVQPLPGTLKRHDGRAGDVPDQRPGEDRLTAEAIRRLTEQHHTEPQAGKGRKHEGAETANPNKRQRGEKPQGLRRKQPRLDHARRHIRGEEQIVELEYGAQ